MTGVGASVAAVPLQLQGRVGAGVGAAVGARVMFWQVLKISAVFWTTIGPLWPPASSTDDV